MMLNFKQAVLYGIGRPGRPVKISLAKWSSGILARLGEGGEIGRRRSVPTLFYGASTYYRAH